MLFNSFEYLVFLPLVFICYWFIVNKNLKLQNVLLLFASYIFYGWWDYRFLLLIALSSLADYVLGMAIYKTYNKKKKKRYLVVSVLFNLGVLGFFKYFNFFITSWQDLLSAIGYEAGVTWTLKIILPVGISFYTFQTMSYTIDIYRKKLRPTEDFIAFAAFVSFFPQLVAGPIERATNLLPQIQKKRVFKYEQGLEALQLILWGLFKKVAVADSLAPLVNEIFANYHAYDGGTLLLGAVYFAVQIYGDFSGYSDIAIGTAKLFGFDLMTNFKFPYFSRNIGEFWRRWHISLSTWFRDYLYIPIGGSKGGNWQSIRNICTIFLISGFWHGANWTFIVWGAIHALLYIPSFLFGTNKKYTTSIIAENTWFPTLKELWQIVSTFFFVTLAWIFFRAERLEEAFEFIYLIFKSPLDFNTLLNPYDNQPFFKEFFFIGVLFGVDYLNRKENKIDKLPPILQVCFFVFLTISIIISFQKKSEMAFIYFNF